MAENPKMDCGLMGSQKIWVSDLTDGSDNSDSFVIDMETFSHGPSGNDTTQNSRITLQRNLSRKGSQREKTVNSAERNSIVADTSSPRENAGTTCGVVRAVTDSAATVTTDENGSNSQQVHQITINTSKVGTPVLRRNGSRRYSLDPKRVVMLFASLSSMGTMLMIYLTLKVSKKAADESGIELDWQQ